LNTKQKDGKLPPEFHVWPFPFMEDNEDAIVEWIQNMAQTQQYVRKSELLEYIEEKFSQTLTYG
jgi:hypothetical protein